MGKINIILKDKDYQIDKSVLAPAATNLQSHLQTEMSGTGTVINLDGVNYNIDSTKLSISRDEFTSHLGTISGNGSKAIVNGVEYSMDSTKLDAATTGLHTTLYRLESGEVEPDEPVVTGAAGLYETGTNTLITSWEDLIANGTISINGSEIKYVDYYTLNGDLVLPDDNSITSINNYAFSCCENLTSITIPNSVTNIGLRAFQYCSKLTNIIIPDGVTEIQMNTFEYCSNLTNVTMGSGVALIYDNAFQYCSNLVSVTLPSSIAVIYTGAFRGCNMLADVYYQGTKAQWGTLSIYSSNESLTNATIHYAEIPVAPGTAGLYETGTDNLITSWEDLVTNGAITVENNVIQTSDRYSLSGDLVLPDSIISIGDNAFNYCGVSSVVISDSVTSIGEYAFYNCSGLTSIEIPNSVTSIGSGAFRACSNLTSVVIGDGVMSITERMFNECKQITHVTIGNSVTSIGQYAFYECNNLAQIIIPDSVMSIDTRAFNACKGLMSVVIGSGVTSINSEAFEGCYKLVEVINKSSHITVTKGSSSNGYVGYYALSVYNSDSGVTESQLIDDNGYTIYTDGAENILLDYSGVETNLVLPSYITQIHQRAFDSDRSLTSIEIPDSVTSIGDYAFFLCSSLTNITYMGTKEQWKAIIKGNSWDRATGSYIITCTDGTIAQDGTET